MKNERKAGAILSYLSIGIGSLVSILYTPVMLRLLGQSEYGLYNLVKSVVAYLGLLNFGFGSTYIRYYSKFKAEEDQENIAKLNGMFLIIFSAIGFISILAGLLLVFNTETIFGSELTTNELARAKILMAILVINMAISFPNIVFNSHITANEKFIFQKVLQIVKKIANPFLMLPILLLGYGSIGLVAVTTLLNLSIEVINIIFCFKKLNIKFKFKNLDFSLMKEMTVFSSYIFLYMIVDQINWNVDKFILGRFRGTNEVAIYSVGSQLNSYLIQFSTVISYVFIARVHELVATDVENKKLTNLFTKIGRIQFYFIFLVIMGFVTFGQSFINLWAGSKYNSSYYVAVILMIPMLIPLIQNIGIEIRKAKNKHKTPAIVYTIGALFNILLTIPLTIKYGSTGSAIGTSISLFILNGIFINVYYHKVIGLNVIRFWKEISSLIKGVFIPVIIAVSIYHLLYNEITHWKYLLIAIPFSFLYFLSVYLFSFNEYEKRLVFNDKVKDFLNIK